MTPTRIHLLVDCVRGIRVITSAVVIPGRIVYRNVPNSVSLFTKRVHEQYEKMSFLWRALWVVDVIVHRSFGITVRRKSTSDRGRRSKGRACAGLEVRLNL